MRKYLLLFLFPIICMSSLAAEVRDTIRPRPADIISVDAILQALYDVISGPAGEKRDWDRMRSLFTEEARLTATGKKKDGTVARKVMRVEDYISSSGPYLEQNGFFETEIGRKTEQFGQIVHVFSTYESRNKKEDSKPFMRGINSIQLWNDGQRWWILSVLWQSESADTPIPGKYLTQN